MKTTDHAKDDLAADIALHDGLYTPAEVIRLRIRGTPWFARGKGNRAARRCKAIVQRMILTRYFGPQFDRLNANSR